ncbi:MULTISPECIES: NADH:flavin oxidoreductase/NADH oxidase family protein [Corynebacterium]|nr:MULTISPECIES: NADH:flavin oxidoreductase/NADH oxidase family protein [Corynebacterium]WNI12703.1 NADH:flavin oxidoreductase/NADH oxidase family protein [Corynebacterium sp. Z-1]
MLSEPMTLPCGASLKNRIFKSAMNEALGNRDRSPSEDLINLYQTWASSGAGLLITGNVMVDSRHLGEPGQVVIEDERDLDKLGRWASAATRDGAHVWMQLNHPGKQSPRAVNALPVAPSAVSLGREMEPFFAVPRELSVEEIAEVQARFVTAARVAKKAGFTGVQIHAAHGYLVNQFLSPLDNRRTDAYGGSLDNRMRFLTELYEKMRAELGAEYPIGVKLNSSDGVEGGFSSEESLAVTRRLAELGVDMVEVSGGTYTASVFEAGNQSGVFFAEHARLLDDVPTTAIGLTGGVRSAADMEAALAEGIADLVGVARPLALDPQWPARVLAGDEGRIEVPRISTGIAAVDKAFQSILVIAWYEQQLKRIARGKQPKRDGKGLGTLLATMRTFGPSALKPRRARRG